jgi:hypothetical protein
MQLEDVAAAHTVKKLGLKALDQPLDDAVGPRAAADGPPLLDSPARNEKTPASQWEAGAVVKQPV